VLRLWARTLFGEPPCEGPEITANQEPEGRPLCRPELGVDFEPSLPLAIEPDVHPDGRVRNITSGWLAASHRPDPARPDWTRAGYDPFEYPEDRAPSLLLGRGAVVRDSGEGSRHR